MLFGSAMRFPPSRLYFLNLQRNGRQQLSPFTCESKECYFRECSASNC
jgi:hypothetical protein